MAIAKHPKRPQRESENGAAEKFILGAGKPPPHATREAASGRRVPTMIRFDRELLAKVDAAAKRRGISRSAWVQYMISRTLEEEDR
jgi:predicted HicB family RNase H-like nuclease